MTGHSKQGHQYNVRHYANELIIKRSVLGNICMCVTTEQYNNRTKRCCDVGNHVTHAHEYGREGE